MSEKLVLIDGNSVIYRAFFAIPLLNNNKGVYTNAVYGFTNMLLKILKDEEPSHILIAFDAGKTTFRHHTYGDYKGGREKTPQELSEQIPLLKEVLDAFHIAHYQLDLYEADDIIGTYSKRAQEQGWDVTIISGDKDLLQLISDNVTVKMTKKGITDSEIFTPDSLKEKMSITPSQVIDLKALMGDNSDNIPGVPGVGEKTAQKLLNQFETIDNVYDHIQEVSGKKLKEKLQDHKEQAFMSKQLVTIERNSPVEMNLTDMHYSGYSYSDVQSIFKDLGFESLLSRLDGNNDEDAESNELTPINFTIVNHITEDMLTNETALVLEILDDNYHYGNIEGIGIVNQTNAYFVPTETACESRIFKEWAENPEQTKIVFDAKKTLVALLNKGIYIQGITFDMLLASYLINPAENNHDIPMIAQRIGEANIQFDEEVYGKGAKMQVPDTDTLSYHIVRKTSYLYNLKDQMEEQLKTNEQYDLFKDLELPLALILGEMEQTGVKINTDRLKQMEVDMRERLEQLEAEIHALAGEEFNINSPKQLGPILFEKLELPVIKKTKTGYSTAAGVLEQLEDKHEIIPKLLLYRQLDKLQSTYIVGLQKVVDQNTEKIHTRFNQALTQTGRLSSVEPNLQNIPIRLEEGRKIRQAFVPSHKDWMMFSADYSQIELRVLAHIAGDSELEEAFTNNLDIHTKTAMDVFHVKRENVTDNMRRQAKAVNFGIVYGISDFGLAQNLDISRQEAKAFIDKYFESYPYVKTYMDEIVQKAKHQGYVTTLMNRRRYLPDITSRNFNRRSFAERTAMNTPIQGSAADIIKKAMIDLLETLKNSKLEARMLLQVHDELILEAPKEEIEELKKIVPKTMEQTVNLSVPLEVDYAYGNSWFEAK